MVLRGPVVSFDTWRVLMKRGDAHTRRTPYHLAKGDVVELQVIEPSSPFKSPWLELPHRDLRCLHPKVFEELKLAHETGKVIRGRVLNSVGGGYAVGIGGLVGFLPQSKMGSVSTIRALGGLKEFTIASISGNVWNHRIVLAGVTGMRREML